MTSTPVLALPDFSDKFIIECDASEAGIGAILIQNERPVAFYSQAMAAQHSRLPAYEKELIGLAKAIRHWRTYFWGNSFVVRTDHCSLKYLLEQRITTAPQQKWISKLLGFDFHVEYKPGRSNTAVDALSRRDEEVSASLCAVSIPQLAWIAELKKELRSRQDMQPLIKKIQEGEAIGPWKFQEEVVWYKNKLFIPKDSTLAANIIAFVHNSCHEGYQKTMFRISREFYWQGMRSHIKEFVATCLICQ